MKMTSVLRLVIPALAGVVSSHPLWADDTSNLAQNLANPLANIISVPLQYNFDQNMGLADSGSRTTVNLQPIVPFQLGENSTLITRTIIPYITQEDVIPGTRQSGLGDVLFSAWASPKSAGRLTWGLGPVLRIPTGSAVSSDTWAGGVTGIVLTQTGPWTFGALANQLWHLESDPKTPTNLTFLQPFLSYSTANALTFSVQSESSYDWDGEAMSVPINAAVSKLVFAGDVPINLQAGVGYWAQAPDEGAEGLRFRLHAQVVLPRRK